MLLSIIIPCYNNWGLLEKMLNCCIEQSFTDWELIMVDDCSSDETPSFCRRFAEKDKRISFYSRDREPKGSVTCRNIGFEKSKGKYIIHFDADDLISKTCFEKRVEYMESHPEIDYATFPAMGFINEDTLPKYDESKHMFGIERRNMDLLESFLRAKYSFSTWNNIYRKEALIGIHWDEKVKIYTDFCFIVPCILFGLKHAFCNNKEVDYFYRMGQSNGAMTSSYTKSGKAESTLYLFNKTLMSLKERNDFSKRKKQFLGMISLHYERLLISKDKKAISDYLLLLKSNYSLWQYYKYCIANEICRCSLYNRYVVYLVETIIFRNMKYVTELYKKLVIKS